MALAQRLTNTGVLQAPGTFDELSLLTRAGPDSAIAAYPSTTSGTGLTYTGTPGVFTWTCPANVYTVSVVCIGGGGAGGTYRSGGGGGGGLGYKQIPVIPNTTYTVVAGAGGVENITGSVNSGGDSYFISTSIVKGGGGGGGLTNSAFETGGGAGGTFVGDGGGNGGKGGNYVNADGGGGGGGAGGYAGNGGDGASSAYGYQLFGGNPATNSGGAGGASNGRDNPYGFPYSAGGGGVGLLGKGADGAGGAPQYANIDGGNPGTGGSGGTNGSAVTGSIAPYGGLTGTGRGGAGGTYGGGGGGGGGSGGGAGGPGAVRITWGQSRYYPNDVSYSGTIVDQRLLSDGTFHSYPSFDEYTLNPSRTSPTSGTTIRKQTVSSYQIYDSFDEVSLAYTITPDKKIANEGDTVTYTINAPMIADSNPFEYSVRFNPLRITPVHYIATSGGNGAVLNARSNNWTIEFWFKTSAYSDTVGNGQYVLDLLSGANFAFLIGFGNAGTSIQLYDGTNNQSGAITAYPLNQWNHFALVCNTTLTIYINGVAQSGWNGVTNNIVSNAYTTNINQFRIGSGALGAGTADWYFSQFRINNSTSVYSGAFTAPTRLSAIQSAGTNIRAITTGTMLLACNRFSFVDASSNAYTLTPYTNTPSATPTISTDVPTFVSSSIFDSNGFGTLYYSDSGSASPADFTGGLVYGVTPLTWSGTATATLWSFTGITQLSTSGSGTGAVFSIRKNNATTTMGTHGVLTVIPTSPGSGYQVGDTITIDGASLGLTTTTNNLTITVGSDWFAQAVAPSTASGTGMGAVTAGAATWTCPDGVYRISVVCVGSGAGGASGGFVNGGGGGALAYIQDYAVTPGSTYAVQAGVAGTAAGDGATSYFVASTLISGGGGATNGVGGNVYGNTPGTIVTGYRGGDGGASATLGGGGGGAGGYTGRGGNGGTSSGASPNLVSQSGANSTGGGGGGGSTGGGAGTFNQDGTRNNSTTGNGGGGGGVGLLGAANIGLGGVNLAGTTGAILGQSGFGGSGGSQGGAPTATVGGAGAIYGGGGGGGTTTGGVGGAGAVRIIWNYPHGFLPSTTALTNITNTKLLTAQSATITDVTGINTITNVASVVAQNTTIPFAGTYAYQFNGTTQYLTIPSSSNFVFGSSDDFTIEGYLYTSATTINKGLIYKRSGSGISGVNFGTSTTTASRFQLRVANADGSAWTIDDATAGTFAINTWYHFAITKTNGVVYLYINGLLTRQYTHTTAIYDDGSVLNIGRDPGGSFWVGHLSNIRIIKGTALYYPPSTIVKRNYPDYPFVVDDKGAIPISNGAGTLALTVGQDILQEGVQDIQLSLRSGSTSGTVLATAPPVLIADTSRPLALPGGGQCWCAYPDYVSGPNLVYTGTPGVFTFTAPKGYTAVSAVAIGAGGAGGPNGGGGGGGGALAYSASIAVTAGTTYTITCGSPGISGGSPTAGGASSFASTIIANGGQPGGTFAAPTGGAGGTVGAGTGFAGGAGGAGVGTYAGGGGGGAGGYTVAGGAGGAVTGTWPTITAASGVSSATGGAGGGGGGSATAGPYAAVGGGGGGTSPFGSVAVASIAGIAYAGTQSSPGQGGSGSGGNPTTAASGVQLGQRGYTAAPYPNGALQPPHGGRFGGGGGAGDGNNSSGGNGGPGCVRIIWGTGRAYPSTLTADRVSGYPAAVGNPTGQQ